MKYYIIKQSFINIFIYLINYFLSSYISLQILTHILSFITIIILIDAVIIQNDLKILEIKYNNLLKNVDINNDIIIIKSKIDLLTSQLNNFTNNDKSIDININTSPRFDYKLARNALVKSKSIPIRKSPKKEMEIPIMDIGEIITLNLKK